MKKNIFILILIIILFQGVFGFVGKVEAAEVVRNNPVKGQVPNPNAPPYYIRTGYGESLSAPSTDANGNTYWTVTNSAGQQVQWFQQLANSSNISLMSGSAPESIGNAPGRSTTPAPAPTGAPLPDCWTGVGNGFISIPGCMANAGYVVLLITSRLLWAAGWLFNITIGYSLNIGDFLEKVQIINIGWGVFRDIANICFIFVLLAIAISTILQIESYNAKKMLAKVIIAALLLNFSLFFTKVVIDSSNILALQVCTKITGDVCNPNNLKDAGIAQTFIQGLGISGIYKVGADNGGDSVTNGKNAAQSLVGSNLTTGNVLAVTLGGAVLILVTAFVFFAATILFIIRTVTLIFVMILSPVAFVARIFPNGDTYFKDWSKTLINQSFFAPAYMLLLFIVVSIVSGNYGDYKDKLGISHSASLGTFLAGNGDAVGTVYAFVVIIGLMIGSLFIAKEMGAKGGDFARNIAGKASFGVAGWTGRQTIGRGAKALGESAMVKNLTNSKRVFGLAGVAGRGLEKGLKRTSESSMDIRNVGGFGKAAGLGDAGGKGGFAKSFKDSQKDWEEQQKRVVSISPLELNAKEKEEEKLKLAEKEYKRINELPLSETTEENYEKLAEAEKIVKEHKKAIEDITQKAKDRGGSFATPDFMSKLGTKIGLTTAQMAMVRKVRKDGNKSKKEKLRDLAAEVAAEEAAEENKEKAGAEPK